MRLLIDVRLAAHPSAPSEARRQLAALAGKLPNQTYEDVRILVSELVTNSVRHSGLHRGDQVRFRLGLLGDSARLRVEVSDAGPGFTRYVRPSTPDQIGGWGLQIVDRLSDRWGVDARNGDGAAVWFEIDLLARQSPRWEPGSG